MRRGRGPVERFARATAVAAALATATVQGVALGADAAPASNPVAIGDAGAEVVFRALSLLGVNYRFGGNTPETGLDCSGLVRLVFSDALGLPLPRRSEEISRVGPAVPSAELQPGDLVFFNTLRRAFSHVGIYIGNNQFVHAPSTGGAIRVENLRADYWSRRFDGARRLLTHDLVAAASLNPLSASAARAMQATAGARTERTRTDAGGAASASVAVPDAAGSSPSILATGPVPGAPVLGARMVGAPIVGAPVIARTAPPSAAAPLADRTPPWPATEDMPAAFAPSQRPERAAAEGPAGGSATAVLVAASPVTPDPATRATSGTGAVPQGAASAPRAVGRSALRAAPRATPRPTTAQVAAAKRGGRVASKPVARGASDRVAGTTPRGLATGPVRSTSRVGTAARPASPPGAPATIAAQSKAPLPVN